jgi:hypothetical protein
MASSPEASPPMAEKADVLPFFNPPLEEDDPAELKTIICITIKMPKY